MRVLVTGGRDYSDAEAVWYWLDVLNAENQIDYVIHGGASGADTLASDWADMNGITQRVVFADWAAHGRAAGPMRNQAMLDSHFPTLVVAFPGGRGTADMVKRAKAAGIEVIQCS